MHAWSWHPLYRSEGCLGQSPNLEQEVVWNTMCSVFGVDQVLECICGTWIQTIQRHGWSLGTCDPVHQCQSMQLASQDLQSEPTRQLSQRRLVLSFMANILDLQYVRALHPTCQYGPHSMINLHLCPCFDYFIFFPYKNIRFVQIIIFQPQTTCI